MQPDVAASVSRSDLPGPALGVLTSGGDAQGMNAAVRAVVRTALRLGARPYAVHEGWGGAVAGGPGIRPLGWDDVGGVLHVGGTVLGSARCQEFRTREGRRAAAANLVRQGIDRLVVIGGDGSLRGAEEFRQEWPELLAELVAAGELDEAVRLAHPRLAVAGLVGSIDNDLAGTDMTIGADTALHRILEAVDALRSTAASHRRTFVVEVMGRHCGYLALMAAVAGGADAVLVPEDPPGEGWRDALAEHLLAARGAGLRDLIVIVAEGATDRAGNPITSQDVGALVTERLGGEGARVTVLGHVQRGGRPSAYDRWMPTLLGYAATQHVLSVSDASATVLGVRHNCITLLPLERAIAATNAVRDAVAAQDFAAARVARGGSFASLAASFAQLCSPPDLPPDPTGSRPARDDGGRPPRRIAVLHAGGLAPGMNAAVRALVRTAAVTGDRVLGVQGSVPGLAAGDLRELGWAEVDDWGGQGGAVLGTRRLLPDPDQVAAIARVVQEQRLDALVLVGGGEAYRTAAVLTDPEVVGAHPALRLPVVCVPATISNDLPGADLSIGADTALNTVVEALDKVRMSASASRRCFVVETMGGACGYLAMMSGLAAGAERVYLPEEHLTVRELAADAARMTHTFQRGRRLWLAIRGEEASASYTTDVLTRVFEEEGGDLFDVRSLVLGHVQDGGDPTPFDRLLATRLARAALGEVDRQLVSDEPGGCCVGEVAGASAVTPLGPPVGGSGQGVDRPGQPWWLGLRPVGDVVNDRYSTAEVLAVPTAVDR
ncbi:6-phosphofructokinase [Ornithinimicrobium cerasi]|uniref:6-phosphofructokinase n=1 Tax=Ornithinimicrobium cerasi TaxID=2248773 RepID=UPI000F000B18|nr:6-phosphofructokinase [Ornithinimicrobium cerasi]